MNSRPPATWFLTWDGPQQPYLKSLFLPVLKQLASRRNQVKILQFSWGTQPELTPDDLGPVSLQSMSSYRALFPLSFPAVVARGAAYIARHAGRDDTLVPRSHLPAAVALAAKALQPSLRLVWDMDGRMPLERVEFAGWNREGLSYRSLMAIERTILRVSRATIVRTQTTKHELERDHGLALSKKLFVIGNGRDALTFREATDENRATTRARIRVPDGVLLLVYCGSIGPQYQPERMVALFEAISKRHPDAHWLVLSGAADDFRKGLPPALIASERIHALRCDPNEVPLFLQACDVGVALRTATASQRAVSPVKIGEYLLSGLPVIASAHIGDVDTQFTTSDVVMRMEEQDPVTDAVKWLDSWYPADRSTRTVLARQAGLEHFSLDRTVAAYRNALELPHENAQ